MNKYIFPGDENIYPFIFVYWFRYFNIHLSEFIVLTKAALISLVDSAKESIVEFLFPVGAVFGKFLPLKLILLVDELLVLSKRLFPLFWSVADWETLPISVNLKRTIKLMKKFVIILPIICFKIFTCVYDHPIFHNINLYLREKLWTGQHRLIFRDEPIIKHQHWRDLDDVLPIEKII